MNYVALIGKLVSFRKFRFIQGWPEEQPPMTSKFHPDYKYESTMFDSKLNWRFYLDRVQVEQYPALKGLRTSDWGWLLVNRHVVFTSGEFPDMDKWVNSKFFWDLQHEY